MLSSLVQGFISLIVFYILYYGYWQLTVGASRRALIRERGCKPVRNIPDLNGFPHNIFGYSIVIENLKAIKKGNYLTTVQQRFLKYGANTIHSKVFFTEIYQTVEPENLKTILAINFNDYSYGSRRRGALLPLLGHGIFTNNGAAWQHSRELLRPNFTRSIIGDVPVFEAHVQQMIKALPRDGSTVDLQELFFQLTMDSSTELLFGESTACLASGQTSEHSVRFAEAFNRSQHETAQRNRFGPMYGWMGFKKQFRQDVRTCHDFVDHFVRKGLEYRKTLDLSKGPPNVKDGERYTFLNELVKRTADPIQIRSELMNVLLAGRDTTASLLSEVWFMLARRPDVWAKLKAEVDELGGKPPTWQQIKDMKYMRMVLNETLRLYPVVVANMREAEVDTILPLGGGEDGKSPLFIPKGQLVQYSIYSMQRRKDLYGEDAEEYRPERWASLKPGWGYMPFSGGPRICVGQQLALTQASYTTIRLMQEFKAIESRDPRPWQEQVIMTCAIHQGARVGLMPA